MRALAGWLADVAPTLSGSHVSGPSLVPLTGRNPFFSSITAPSREPPARMQGILQAAKLSAAGASAAASKAAISSSARASAQLLRPAAPQSIEQKNKQAASLSHNARSFSLAAVAEAPAPVEQETSTSGPE